MGDEESRKERTSGGVSVQLEEEQKCLLKELQTAVERQEDKEHLEELLWKTLTVFQGCPFYTVKNLEFVYEIRGNEMFVNRKDKSITRASISLAFEKALELQKTEGTVKGPKKLNCFGATGNYLEVKSTAWTTVKIFIFSECPCGTFYSKFLYEFLYEIKI